jgi:hypothetical protein
MADGCNEYVMRDLLEDEVEKVSGIHFCDFCGEKLKGGTIIFNGSAKLMYGEEGHTICEWCVMLYAIFLSEEFKKKDQAEKQKDETRG